MYKRKIVEQDTAHKALQASVSDQKRKHQAMEKLWKSRADEAPRLVASEKALKAKVSMLEAEVRARAGAGGRD